MNIVFMGTPEFAVPSLESLNEAGHNISLVITQKDRPRGRGKKLQPTPVKDKALELGLKVYQPESINSKDSIHILKGISPDFIVVVAYGQILKKEILEIPRYGCINIHGSLLPKYRGAAPINWAIINGEEKTGITIIEMEEGLDTGDMLIWEEIPIGEDDDSETIHDKLALLGSKLIVKAIDGLERGKISKTPQDDKLSTYASKITKDMGNIDWNLKGQKIKNLVRGLKPWPSAYIIYKGEKVKIHKVSIIDKFLQEDNGVVVKVSNDGIYVNCQDSCVIIEELQFPGGKKLNVRDYLRGNKFDSNIRLG